MSSIGQAGTFRAAGIGLSDRVKGSAREGFGYFQPIAPGSVITPVNAEAATVAGEPMYTFELGSPMRPLKLRVVAVMHTSSGPMTPMWPPPHAPQVGGAMIAPASVSFSSEE